MKAIEDLVNKGITAFYDELIEKHIAKLFGSLDKASIQFFIETGVVNGGFRSALHRLLKASDKVSEQAFGTVWRDAEKDPPPYNLGVLVFIPYEDNHITSGMLDVSGEWILLDEYREATGVRYWAKMPPEPK